MKHTDDEATKFFATTTRRPCVAYARVSTLAQSENSLSIEQQFAQIFDYATKKGMEVILNESDEMSGYGWKSDHRPGFQAALRTARQENAPIVVYTASRLTRWLPTARALRASGIRIHSVDHGYLSQKALIAMVARAQAEAEAKSEAQKARSGTLRSERSRGKILTAADRRRGAVNNLLRRDDNIFTVAGHFATREDRHNMTWNQRVDSLNRAGITRTISGRSGRTARWTRDALRKNWHLVEEQIALLREE